VAGVFVAVTASRGALKVTQNPIQNNSWQAAIVAQSPMDAPGISSQDELLQLLLAVRRSERGGCRAKIACTVTLDVGVPTSLFHV
jgi:hypothetical protein